MSFVNREHAMIGAKRRPCIGDHVEYTASGSPMYVGLIVGFLEADLQASDVPVYDKDIAMVARRSAHGGYTETPFRFSTLREADARR